MCECEVCRMARKDEFGKLGSVSRGVMECMVHGFNHAKQIARICITTVKNVNCIQCRLRKKFNCKSNEELINIYRHAKG